MKSGCRRFFEGNGVQAIPEAARGGAIGKDVAEVGIAGVADRFYSLQEAWAVETVRDDIILSPRLTGRNTQPSVNPAATVQASMATFTHAGIATVRTWPCFPTRSTMHQRPSRCSTCKNESAATSDRRSPQPRRTAMMARFRSPFTVVVSGALRSACACRSESQFPTRIPTDFALSTRAMPAANSGASSPLSAASAASLRTAGIRMMMDDDPSPRASSDTRQALTVALVNPGRGSCRYPSDEFVQRHVVHPARNRRGHAFEHERLQPLPFRDLFHHNQFSHLGLVNGPYRKPCAH